MCRQYFAYIKVFQALIGMTPNAALFILLNRLLLTDDDRCSKSYLVFCSVAVFYLTTGSFQAF